MRLERDDLSCAAAAGVRVQLLIGSIALMSMSDAVAKTEHRALVVGL